MRIEVKVDSALLDLPYDEALEDILANDAADAARRAYRDRPRKRPA